MKQILFRHAPISFATTPLFLEKYANSQQRIPSRMKQATFLRACCIKIEIEYRNIHTWYHVRYNSLQVLARCVL